MDKIVIVVPSNLPVPASKGGAVEILIQNFIEINELEKKLEVTVISEFDRDAVLLSNNFKYTKFVWIRKGWWYHIINFFLRGSRRFFGERISHLDIFQIVRTIKKLKADKIIIEGNSYHLLELAKYLSTDKLIFHVHAKIISESNILNERIVSCASKTIVVSNYIKDEILKYTNLDPSKLYILKNGIDTNRFNKNKIIDSKGIRFKHNIKRDIPIILFVGRIVESKGIHHLLNALIKIKNCCDLHLLIAGSFGSSFGLREVEDEYSQNLRQKVWENKEWISLVGFISNYALPEYYSASDLVVVPSLCDESASLVALEARASGTPLIITDVGGMPEYVTEKCAIIVKRSEDLANELSSKIMELIIDTDRLKSMGIEAKRDILKYSRESYYKNFIDIISS